MAQVGFLRLVEIAQQGSQRQRRGGVPLGQASGGLVAELGADGEIYYTTNDIGTDGAPYSFTTCRGEYGIISVKDYLAGSQDWVQVTLQGRDLV